MTMLEAVWGSLGVHYRNRVEAGLIWMDGVNSICSISSFFFLVKNSKTCIISGILYYISKYNTTSSHSILYIHFPLLYNCHNKNEHDFRILPHACLHYRPCQLRGGSRLLYTAARLVFSMPKRGRLYVRSAKGFPLLRLY